MQNTDIFLIHSVNKKEFVLSPSSVDLVHYQLTGADVIRYHEDYCEFFTLLTAINYYYMYLLPLRHPVIKLSRKNVD